MTRDVMYKELTADVHARESLLREMRGALTVAHAMAQRGRADLARQWEKLAADYLERAIQQHYDTIH